MIGGPGAAPASAIASAPASATVSAPTAATTARLQQAAHAFEANTIAQMLQPMFDTVDLSSGMFGGGDGEKTWAPMMITQIAQQVERRGGLGLAAPVYQEMLRLQEHAGGTR